MKAFFTAAKSLIDQAVQSESRKHEEGQFLIEVYKDGEYTVSEGSTQQIMYLLGEVAGYGEDSLVRVDLS